VPKRFVSRLLFLSLLPALAPAQDHTTWRDYGGGSDSAQYSALKQVDRSNVSRLEVAWTYPTGDNQPYIFNPLIADGVLYVAAKRGSIVALEAATGKEMWSYSLGASRGGDDADDAGAGRGAGGGRGGRGGGGFNNRGINYWQSKDGSDRRLVFAANDKLQEVDARTGKLITSFGENGYVDLKEGLGRDPKTQRRIQSRTPGRVFENLIILGSATNQGYGSAPGDIRAYDVHTGKLVWTFHTIPHPGEFGYDTWPKDAWKTVGGVNVWGEFTVDEKRAILFVPTASPKYNFYGADRIGMGLFGDSLLALDARTGKRLWHFQMVHHDIWDYDNATAPKLLTLKHNGKMVDAVAQAGKTGFLYVFNRETGESLFPIEERPVPKSDVPGEQTWPTQPVPLAPPPFARQKFTVDDLNPYLSPEDQAHFRDEMLSARNEGMFTPPAERGTVEMPGNNGGSNFGGAAADSTRGWMFIVSKDLPAILKLSVDKTAPEGTTRYVSGFNLVTGSNGLSPIRPPWTSLTAYDLNDGTIRWRMPLGDVPELAAKGITGTGTHYPKANPVVTAGGLLFIGTRDKMVRAFETQTGELLWEKQLPAAMEGMPAVYEMNGREYIVFCASAQVGLTRETQEKIQGSYVAFALPEKK
jgi:glucose dehydrogenase